MQHSIETELKAYIVDKIDDGVIDNDNVDEWHHHLFNEDYYMIGYYNAEEWLKTHEVSPFEAIGDCMEYERDHFGEVNKTYDNAETTVNMYVYILGEELLAEAQAETVEELKEFCT